MNITLVPEGLTDSNTMHRGLKVVDNNGVTRVVVVIPERSQTGRVDLKLGEELQRLIAAAPELLEACKEAMVLGAHGVGSVNTSDDPYCKANAERNISECIRIMRVLRAAIAKAEGGAA